MDVLQREACVAQVVRPPYLVGQHVLRQVAALVQPLPHGLGHHDLGDARRQGVDGHDASRQLLTALLFQQGVGHPAADTAALGSAVEDIRLAPVEGVFAVFLMEKRDVQHAALVHGAHLHHRLTAGDAVGGGLLRQHSAAAGVFPLRQVADGEQLRAILPAAGIIGDQVAQRADVQLFQRLGAGLAHALDEADIGVEIGHGRTLPCGFCPL